jgi:pimeloyl-ACP methyl ester carboxylesterase
VLAAHSFTIRLGALGILGFALAVVVGSFLYLVVTFTAMRAHVPARSWRRMLRAFVHEAFIVALTQPLVPAYYVIGRKMGGATGGRPVIFIHGYFQNRVDFIYLARAARRAHLGPLYGWNYDWLATIESSSQKLGRFVERVCRETGKERVAIVAHSLGGLVALEYLATEAGAARVERCITIGTPYAGVGWRIGMIGRAAKDLYKESPYMLARRDRGAPPVVTSFYSTHDNIVHPAATSEIQARGGRDVAVGDMGHLGLLFSRSVAEQTIAALQEG